MNDEVLTLDLVAADLKVSVETARRLCADDKLAWVPRGLGQNRVHRGVLRSALEAYKRDQRRATVAREMRNIRETHDAMQVAEERW
jgi:hypothetical protein